MGAVGQLPRVDGGVRLGAVVGRPGGDEEGGAVRDDVRAVVGGAAHEGPVARGGEQVAEHARPAGVGDGDGVDGGDRLRPAEAGPGRDVEGRAAGDPVDTAVRAGEEGAVGRVRGQRRQAGGRDGRQRGHGAEAGEARHVDRGAAGDAVDLTVLHDPHEGAVAGHRGRWGGGDGAAEVDEAGDVGDEVPAPVEVAAPVVLGDLHASGGGVDGLDVGDVPVAAQTRLLVEPGDVTDLGGLVDLHPVRGRDGSPLVAVALTGEVRRVDPARLEPVGGVVGAVVPGVHAEERLRVDVLVAGVAEADPVAPGEARAQRVEPGERRGG